MESKEHGRKREREREKNKMKRIIAISSISLAHNLIFAQILSSFSKHLTKVNRKPNHTAATTTTIKTKRKTKRQHFYYLLCDMYMQIRIVM